MQIYFPRISPGRAEFNEHGGHFHHKFIHYFEFSHKHNFAQFRCLILVKYELTDHADQNLFP